MRLLRAPHGRLTALPDIARTAEEQDRDATPQTFDTADHPRS